MCFYLLTNYISLLQITPAQILKWNSYQISHEIQSSSILEVCLHDMAYPVNIKVNTKTKLKKPTVSQSMKFQSLNPRDTVRYDQNNIWTRTGIILNKNDMSRSHTMLNDKGNLIRRNRRHLIKVDSKFVKIENDNDMDNDTETEPKTRHIISATKPGKPS